MSTALGTAMVSPTRFDNGDIGHRTHEHSAYTSTPKANGVVIKKTVKTTADSDDDTPLSVRMKTKLDDTIDSAQTSSSYTSNTNDSGVNSATSHSHLSNSFHKSAVKSEPPQTPLKDSPASQSDLKKGKLKPKTEAKTEKRTLDSDDDELPLTSRAKKLKEEKTESPPKKRSRVVDSDDDDDYEDKKPAKSSKKTPKNDKHHDKKHHKDKKNAKTKAQSQNGTGSPTKKKKDDDDVDEWRWWEESRHKDGVKWKTLEHNGIVFAPPYDPLPADVHFYYNGKPVKLSENAEEVATFYGRMLSHDYTKKDDFNNNFFKDWRKTMTKQEKELITDLKKCDFAEIDKYFLEKSEERKAMSKEEKLKLKEENEALRKKYGYAIIDGHKQKVGNFKIEPPGLFRGRGDHPKMGMLKRRVNPEDVTINCSKGSKVPVPPPGHKWKEVKHDNTVTWLASWTENVLGSNKYVMLNPSSKIKGEKDWEKYEKARNLKKHVERIRTQYREDWKSKEMKVRQRAVALYFIDKLALRAGNEKEEGETADTVGCCSLRVEHITLHENMEGEECVVEFDFLGKDSIRYYNRVSVEKRVFKNLSIFMENKEPGDDVFDRLNTSILNEYLKSLMEGLTAKVFRTYNASSTLQEQLDEMTKRMPNEVDPGGNSHVYTTEVEFLAEMSVAEKLLAYNRANRAVALLCNHQRAPPKTHGKQMENLQIKMDEKTAQVKEAKKELKDAKADYKRSKNDNKKKVYEQKQKKLERLEEALQKLELSRTDKEENKEIALSTSKLNYLDPRISVAWCKKWDVPVEKVYNKTQREKFRWAIDMAESDYRF